MVLVLIKDFFKLEASSSVILIFVTLLAMIAANSPLFPYYNMLHTPNVAITIDDWLMAFFFLVIGIEIRHEMHDGEMSTPKQIALPLVAALGGVIVPAIIFTLFNWGMPSAKGWAIPSATDIAFALGALAFLGGRINPSLRMFLMMVAIIDDIAAMIIISVFYSKSISFSALAMSIFCIVILYSYNRSVTRKLPFILAGAALWVAMLDSGINAALSGAIVGMLLPLPMSKALLPKLHPWVAYGVIPIFAFANSGVPLAGLTFRHFTGALPIGIATGLFIGKQLGIFLSAWLMIKCRFASLPSGCNWLQLYGLCIIAGIGFTMSLFIGALAFPSEDLMLYTRIGVIVGSLVSGIIGTTFLALASPRMHGDV